MIHPTAIVESSEVDASTNVWAFAHIMPGARVGRNGNIGDHVFIEGGAVVGDNVTIKNHVCVWDGITIEEGAFIGPAVVFTNDLYPRSPRMERVTGRYARREQWMVPTTIGAQSTIGGGAVIVAGAHVSCCAMVGAGAVVVQPVPPFALVVGNPARKVGYVCRCGQRLSGPFNQVDCTHCGETAQQRCRWYADYCNRPGKKT